MAERAVGEDMGGVWWWVMKACACCVAIKAAMTVATAELFIDETMFVSV